MKKEDFAEILGDINEKQVADARTEHAGKKNTWIKWGALAACLCLVICGGLMLIHSKNDSSKAPNPELLQVTNPLMKVDSLEEMEACLDFPSLCLKKTWIATLLSCLRDIRHVHASPMRTVPPLT